MSLDLEQGDEKLADATPAERRAAARRAARQGKDSEKSTSSTPKRSRASVTSDRIEAELLSRLSRTFDRIAQTLEARDDAELAGVIREDSDAMSQGLVSLTRSVKFLRSPLLMALNLIEPALAFGRVGRTLYVRFAERQQRIAWERQSQQGVASSPVEATQ